MSISFDLTDKQILVTGASSGLGQSIAIHAAQAGANVILLGRNPERLDETASQCDGRGVCVQMDLMDLDALPKLVQSLAKEHGPLSGLVHSAGVYQNVPLRAIRGEKLQSTLALNVSAGVMLLKGLSVRGCHAETASAVFLSSVMGKVGQPGLAGYCMSKGAVEQAVKALALELQPDGIRVNAIAPSAIQTPMIDAAFATLGEPEREAILSTLPSGLGQPEDVAAAAIYLLSDASKFVTGTSMLVDGGYCAQ
ncbi:MAG: SDR family oxidoreductase [Phycisphaerales bacterium]|nr:SDR family oxidoreductase [Phycisphaerales bacterium]